MHHFVRFGAGAPVFLFLALSLSIHNSKAQISDPRYYNIGNPVLADIWLDPVSGDDNNDGASRSTALRTLTAAWRRIPYQTTLTTNGYRINILPGALPCERNCSNYYESRWGTYEFPIVIRAVDGRGTVTIQGGLNIYDVKYLYLIDLNFAAGGAYGAFGNNVLHLHRVDHALMRGLVIQGQNRSETQEVLKANQCRHLYLEDSSLSEASNAVVDYVSTQYGHIVGNRIYDAGNYGIVLKSGSAYFRIEANEIYNSLFGLLAGEGTNTLFMEPPWLHYEAYDIKFINNVVHDTPGAGMNVFGGYNILLANNTLYRTAYNEDPKRAYGFVTLAHGIRVCEGAQESCRQMTDTGAWGPNLPGYENYGQVIPNKNVYIYNNIFYNPAPYRTYYGHFVVYNTAKRPASFQNMPDDLPADENLQIRGNLIWNGPANHPLGVEDPSWGCQPSNPTCNPDQLRSENTINTVEPQFVGASSFDFHPDPAGNLADVKTYPIPDFSWGDVYFRPDVPQGNLINNIDRDRDNVSRASIILPGAYTMASTSVVSAANYRPAVAAESLVAAFGNNLAPTTESANATPLPTTLAGTSVTVRDSAGIARLSPLFAVSPNQVNYQIPSGTAHGAARVSIENSRGSVSVARLQISNVAPGIFSADSSGKGIAAASVLRVRADGSERFERVAQFDPSQNRFVALPVDLGPETDRVFLVLYGTGIRHRSALGAVSVSTGGTASPALFAGAQGGYVGLDQVNTLLPRGLAGRGDIDVAVSVDGVAANSVRINMR